MRRARYLATLLPALAAAALAQDSVNGTWKANDVAFAPWTFILKAEGSQVTGTVSQGAISDGITTSLTQPTPIYDGIVEGNRVSFKVGSPDGGRTISFSGVISGGSIEFTREVHVQAGAAQGAKGIFDASSAATFIARRVSGSTESPSPSPPPGRAAAPSASSGMRLVLLGTGTPNPDPDRSGPSAAIVAGSQAYVVDAGPGVVRRAVAAASRTQLTALRPALLTVLFLTHLHSDHTLGYPDLIFTPAVAGRGKPLEVYGPKGTEEMTGHLMAAWKKDMDVRINGLERGNPNAYKVNVHEIKPGVVYHDGNVTVKAFLVKHATWDEAFGYRFDGAGRSIVISGDTSPAHSVVEACNGCDVLLHEVYCDPGHNAGPYYKAAHTSASELAAIAAEAKPKLLVLYHQLFNGCSEGALVEEVQQGYSGAVVSAKDFDIY